MEVDCARDFMEVLIQRGQGRNSVFRTVLSSNQKRSVKRLFPRMIAQVLTVLDARDCFFFSLPRGNNTQFE